MPTLQINIPILSIESRFESSEPLAIGVITVFPTSKINMQAIYIGHIFFFS